MVETQARPVEWLTLFLIIACVALWTLAGLLWQTPFWIVALPAMAFLAAFYTSLQHETIHGHPTRWPLVNELLVSLPLGVIFPYRRYRDLHLRHHNDLNLTDPFEDPESYFWQWHDYRRMRRFKRRVFAMNNTFVGRLLLGPVLTVLGFARTETRHLIENSPGVRIAWLLHIIGLVALFWIVAQVFGMPVWPYLLFVAYPAASLTSMRAYAEHQAAENVGARSAIIETHPVFSLLFLNNNLHLVHHAHPQLPWYEIPALYRERRQQYLAANGNLLFNGYSEVARMFAFRVKQPVWHPYHYLDVKPAE